MRQIEKKRCSHFISICTINVHYLCLANNLSVCLISLSSYLYLSLNLYTYSHPTLSGQCLTCKGMSTSLILPLPPLFYPLPHLFRPHPPLSSPSVPSLFTYSSPLNPLSLHILSPSEPPLFSSPSLSHVYHL